MIIKLKRAYESPDDNDGLRVLVDRLWPRGLAKDTARIDLWLKEIAPSATLRRWFNHEPSKWAEFQARYSQELKENPQAVMRLRELAAGKTVTLVYAAKDPQHNNAAALKSFLQSGDS